jgi:hypothetical protein
MRALILLVAVLLLIGATSGSANIDLVNSGKSDYCVIIGKDASPSENFAASEFEKYISKITGAVVSYAPDCKDVPENAVLIGDSQALRSLGIDIDFNDLSDEGYVIRTVGNRLIIAGGRLRGTLYGVYGFFESLGCRWYSQTVNKVPEMKSISLGTLDIKEKPAFEYRAIHISEARNPEFGVPNRMNGKRDEPFDTEHGGSISYYPISHSFDKMIPVKEYGASHPEYFSMIDGKRVLEKTQLCMSNPEVVKIATKTVLQWMHDNPDVKVFSVAQNDNKNYCQCPACRKIYEEEGSPAGLLLRFINSIAVEAQKEYPDRIISTLAYQFTEQAPKITKPLSNVRVFLCPIYCCVAHPFEICDFQINKDFMVNLTNWSNLTNNLYLWHYNSNFSYYLNPFPDYYQAMDSAKLYKRYGVKGIFWEGNYNGGVGEFGALRSYLLAKITWNPDTDGKAVMKDFCEGYYGKAAPYILDYIQMLEDRVQNDTTNHMQLWVKPNGYFLSDDIIARADQLFAKAMAAAESPEVLDRVNREYLAIKWVKLMAPFYNKDIKGKEAQLTEELNGLLDECKVYGVTRSSERKTMDVLKREVEELIDKSLAEK